MRRFLATALFVAPLLLAPIPSPALEAGGRIEFVNLGTRETLSLAPERLPSPSVLNRFFRCARARRYTLMDPRLLAAASGAARGFHVARVEVLSAFRTGRENAELRSRGRHVALKSRHIHGQAMDFRLPGVGVEELCAFMRGLRAGGVGCYLRAKFVHIDVGPRRTWTE
jgi:uncharacterized protein YcbK (DUF882 family)